LRLIDPPNVSSEPESGVRPRGTVDGVPPLMQSIAHALLRT
jgi:hypothetical protein